MADLAELERQERAMVEKLNQTRMSAMSVKSAKSNNVTLGQKNGISPFKSAENKRIFATNTKSQRHIINNEDFNDRIVFD